MLEISSKIDKISNAFEVEKKQVSDAQELDSLKNKFLGRKGLVSSLFKDLSEIQADKRKQVGADINSLKSYIEKSIDGMGFKKKESVDNSIDYTLPGTPYSPGRLHPLTIVTNEIKEIFNRIGFSPVFGPEVDTDYYNFEALNIPKHHPARDMQDTFYINDQVLLRTHTSGSQVHFMKNNEPPVRILSPGRVYRNEDISVRSYCLFHQIEGLYVDKNVTFSELKGTLEYFAKEFFGSNVKTRFRPSYFPFTEPSAEMDVYWGLNSESDYRITKGTGWLEILGCGMVDPEVFKSVEYDSDKYSGFAFGLGIERIAMLKYGIDDIRLLYEGDFNFLEQFKK